MYRAAMTIHFDDPAWTALPARLAVRKSCHEARAALVPDGITPWTHFQYVLTR